jgi:hypothetical protein
MNDAWGYEDNAQTQETGHNDGPKALRDAYNAQKAQNEAIMAELAAIRQERATEKLSSVFSELGVPGAASLYQGEPDPEKAKAWAMSMKAAFGTGNAQSETSGEVQSNETALDEQTQAQLQQMTEAGQSGTPIGNFQAAEAAIGSADSIEALIAANAQMRNVSEGPPG